MTPRNPTGSLRCPIPDRDVAGQDSVWAAAKSLGCLRADRPGHAEAARGKAHYGTFRLTASNVREITSRFDCDRTGTFAGSARLFGLGACVRRDGGRCLSGGRWTRRRSLAAAAEEQGDSHQQGSKNYRTAADHLHIPLWKEPDVSGSMRCNSPIWRKEPVARSLGSQPLPFGSS